MVGSAATSCTQLQTAGLRLDIALEEPSQWELLASYLQITKHRNYHDKALASSRHLMFFCFQPKAFVYYLKARVPHGVLHSGAK